MEDASGEIALAALANDNRNFITISVNGAACKALLDPGVTLSLAGPGLAHRHADRLLPSTRVRTATRGVTPAVGKLPITIEVDGSCEKIEFRAVYKISSGRHSATYSKIKTQQSDYLQIYQSSS